MPVGHAVTATMTGRGAGVVAAWVVVAGAGAADAVAGVAGEVGVAEAAG